MKDASQVAYDLLSKARSDGENVDPLVIDILDNLASRAQALEAGRSQVDYAAQSRANREEAEAKRDLAQLLLGAAQSVAGSAQRAAALVRIVNLTVSANAMALLRRVLP